MELLYKHGKQLCRTFAIYLGLEYELLYNSYSYLANAQFSITSLVAFTRKAVLEAIVIHWGNVLTARDHCLPERAILNLVQQKNKNKKENKKRKKQM